jgi:hypothetical protein
VLGFDRPMESGKPPEEMRQTVMEALERHGQTLRKYCNTLVFGVAERALAEQAQEHVVGYLGWRKIQRNLENWERIGGANQQHVTEQMDETESAALQAIVQAYRYALSYVWRLQ